MSSTPNVRRLETQERQKWDRRQITTIVLLCGALFLDAMNTSSVNVALPTIGAQLHMSPATLQWVVSGYLLGFGGFLLLGGRAADLLGRRRVFLGALVVFGAASAVGGLVDSGTLLIAASFIKGVGAAFTIPAGMSILTTTFPEGAGRQNALGAWAATGAAGFTLGLVFGGVLSELGWRYVFLVPAPIAALIAMAGFRVLDRSERSSTTGRHYDVPGAVAITASVMALVYSVVEAPAAGWSSTSTIGGLALSAALLAVFVVVERRSAAPLVRFGILKARTLVSADLAGGLFLGSFLGFQFLATLYVQDVARWSPVDTSLAFLPVGAFLLISGSQVPRMIGRFGTRRLIAAGLIAFAVGYALFLRENSHHLGYTSMLLPSMVLIGLGWALAFPALNVQATAGVDDREQGLAAGLFNASFQIGGAVGVAVVGSVVSSHTTSAGSEAQAVLSSMRPALIILISVALAGVALIGALSGRSFTPASATTDAELGSIAPAEGRRGLLPDDPFVATRSPAAEVEMRATRASTAPRLPGLTGSVSRRPGGKWRTPGKPTLSRPEGLLLAGTSGI
jgi:MFS family permease